MKKVNKVAAQDAVRWVDARETINEIMTKYQHNQQYAKAIDSAVLELDAVPAAVSQRMPSPGMKRAAKIGLLVAGVIILHETGYDEVLWTNAKRLFRRGKRAAQKVVDENPDIVRKAENVKDAVVDLSVEVKDAAKEATGRHESGYDASYDPNITQKGSDASL